MNIRQATIDDVEDLASLFDQYRVFYLKDSDKEAAKKFLLERIDNQESIIFIATDEQGQMLGFVQLYPLFSSTRMQRLWLLNDLFVAPAHRGKRISVALIEAAKTLCISSKSCGMILETAKTNFIGNQLYPKVGFTLDKEHHYYSWDV